MVKIGDETTPPSSVGTTASPRRSAALAFATPRPSVPFYATFPSAVRIVHDLIPAFLTRSSRARLMSPTMTAYVVSVRPDPAEPESVSVVKMRDGESMRVNGYHRQVTDKLIGAPP